MKKLATVRILGHDWNIIDDTESLRAQGGGGECRHQTLDIAVCTDMPGSQGGEVLLHEIIHAIDASLMLGIKEKTVRQFAAAMFQVMRDNPNIVKAICNGKVPK